VNKHRAFVKMSVVLLRPIGGTGSPLRPSPLPTPPPRSRAHGRRRRPESEPASSLAIVFLLIVLFVLPLLIFILFAFTVIFLGHTAVVSLAVLVVHGRMILLVTAVRPPPPLLLLWLLLLHLHLLFSLRLPPLQRCSRDNVRVLRETNFRGRVCVFLCV
jgi:hypothetical protein